MANLKDIVKDIPKREDGAGDDGDVMSDPDYIRQSSKFISDSLRKGQDVLQLENGDVITTETKTVVNQYTWDESKKKMVKTSSRTRKSTKKDDQSSEE